MLVVSSPYRRIGLLPSETTFADIRHRPAAFPAAREQEFKEAVQHSIADASLTVKALN